MRTHTMVCDLVRSQARKLKYNQHHLLNFIGNTYMTTVAKKIKKQHIKTLLRRTASKSKKNPYHSTR